jgi:hypothetical protein
VAQATHSSAAGADSPAAAAAAADSGEVVRDLLPWLVLFGRCCLQWKVQLHWRIKAPGYLPRVADVPQASVILDSFMYHLNINNSVDVFFSSSRTGKGSGSAGAQPLMSLLLAAIQAPLQDASTSAEMSARGLHDTRLELLGKVS